MDFRPECELRAHTAVHRDARSSGLKPPLFEGNEALPGGVCALGEDFRRAVAEPHQGWEWVDDGRPGSPKLGFSTTQAGAPLVIRLDVGSVWCREAASTVAASSGVGPGGQGQQEDGGQDGREEQAHRRRALKRAAVDQMQAWVIFLTVCASAAVHTLPARLRPYPRCGTLGPTGCLLVASASRAQSWRGMGRASLSCVGGGCECANIMLDGDNGDTRYKVPGASGGQRAGAGHTPHAPEATSPCACCADDHAKPGGVHPFQGRGLPALRAARVHAGAAARPQPSVGCGAPGGQGVLFPQAWAGRSSG